MMVLVMMLQVIRKSQTTGNSIIGIYRVVVFGLIPINLSEISVNADFDIFLTFFESNLIFF